MANEPQRPGGPPGVAAMLRDVFEVPATPSIGRAEAAQRVLAAVAAQGVRCERLDISDQPVSRGSLFNAAGARVPFPEGKAFHRCYIALIDPEPTARWAHPAHFAFVPADGEGETVLAPTNLPESSTGPVRLLPFLIDR